MFISPMLCNSLKIPELKSFDHSDYLIEPKYDGIRAIVSICEGEVKIYSRTGKEITYHLPHLVDQLVHIPPGTVLDGEIMLVDRCENVFDTPVAFSDFSQLPQGLALCLARSPEGESIAG